MLKFIFGLCDINTLTVLERIGGGELMFVAVLSQRCAPGKYDEGFAHSLSGKHGPNAGMSDNNAGIKRGCLKLRGCEEGMLFNVEQSRQVLTRLGDDRKPS